MGARTVAKKGKKKRRKRARSDEEYIEGCGEREEAKVLKGGKREALDKCGFHYKYSSTRHLKTIQEVGSLYTADR